MEQLRDNSYISIAVWARFSSGMPTQSRNTVYRKLLAVNPKDAAAHMNLGLLLRATGQKADGDDEVRQAMTLNPQLKDPAAKK